MIQPTPNPVGATISFLSGVSCPERRACLAVGYYTTTGGTTRTLAERWDGRAWQIQPTADPTGSNDSVLTAVSCPGSSSCTATGFYVDSNGLLVTLAEHWDGRSWHIQPTPNPVGATNSSLHAVSCTHAAACTAVGYQVSDANGQRSLVERWNGLVWQIQPIPDPPGTTSSLLGGVSCPAANSCTATGGWQSILGPNLSLAARWDGRAWAIQQTPNPTDAPVSFLDGGVSCPTTNACTAVGSQFTSSFTQLTLAEGHSAP